MIGKPPELSNGIWFEQHITIEMWKIITCWKVQGDHTKKNPYTNSSKFSSLEL
jgi:hypothetical protein